MGKVCLIMIYIANQNGLLIIIKINIIIEEDIGYQQGSNSSKKQTKNDFKGLRYRLTGIWCLCKTLRYDQFLVLKLKAIE